MNAPKYNVKDIIDLRFSRDTMPDRIYVRAVYMRDKDTEWMYQVFSEKKNGVINVSESQINALISKKEGKCYDNEVIKELYNNGFRFCGNNKRDYAFNRANNMVNANYIKHIILAEAIDKDGNVIPGQLGLWVQYNASIDDNKTHNGHYIIK